MPMVFHVSTCFALDQITATQSWSSALLLLWIPTFFASPRPGNQGRVEVLSLEETQEQTQYRVLLAEKNVFNSRNLGGV